MASGDTEAIALTERLLAIFARNLNGSLTIGQAHAFAKQQYFADLGLYGEYDYKALQAATLFGLPMYRYGNGASGGGSATAGLARCNRPHFRPGFGFVVVVQYRDYQETTNTSKGECIQRQWRCSVCSLPAIAADRQEGCDQPRWRNGKRCVLDSVDYRGHGSSRHRLRPAGYRPW